MNREEAIIWIKQICAYLTARNPVWRNEPIIESCNLAIKALEQPEQKQSGQKKGKWIKHEVKLFDGCHTGRYFEECSECGKLTPEWRLVTEYHYWNFCPGCGACNARETT